MLYLFRHDSAPVYNVKPHDDSSVPHKALTSTPINTFRINWNADYIPPTSPHPSSVPVLTNVLLAE